MVILQSLLLAGLLVLFARKTIKRHPLAWYAGATLLALASVGGMWSGLIGELPSWCIRYVAPIFTRGALAAALFFFVMFAGAAANGSAFIKCVMPIRGELSIVASILAIGHGVALGKSQLLHALEGKLIGPVSALAFGVSLVLICLMLPLFVTSFKAIRRKMPPKKWKRLQSFAYFFYALTLIHILFFNLPAARTASSSARIGARINVMVYGALFICYAEMRVRKAVRKRSSDRPFYLEGLAATGALVMAGLACYCFWPTAPSTLPQPAPETSVVSQEAGEPTEAEAEASPAEPDASYADGTYTGRGAGYNGQMKVAVTIEGGRVADISLKSTVDDEEYIADAMDGILPRALAAQSAEGIDVVSGATTSSEGLIEAIADALNQARSE